MKRVAVLNVDTKFRKEAHDLRLHVDDDLAGTRGVQQIGHHRIPGGKGIPRKADAVGEGDGYLEVAIHGAWAQEVMHSTAVFQ